MIKDIMKKAKEEVAECLIQDRGGCKFCGQIRALEVPADWTEEMCNELATELCECTESEIYTRKKKQKEKAVDLVMAATYINQTLAIGTFCVDTDEKYCSFESNELFTGLHGFSREYAERVILSAFSAIEQYNDKLFAVNSGLMTVKEFAAQM